MFVSNRFYWAFCGVTLFVYLVIALWSMPIISRDAGGLVPFDLRPLGYSTEEARVFLSALGEVGLKQYLGAQRILDMIYPALLGLTLLLTLWRMYPLRWALVFGAFAVLGAFFDYQENTAVVDLLKLGPQGMDAEVVSIASAMTSLKIGCSLVAILAIIGWLGWWLFRRMYPKRIAA